MECSSYAGPMYFPYGGKAKVQRRPVRAATSTSFSNPSPAAPLVSPTQHPARGDG